MIRPIAIDPWMRVVMAAVLLASCSAPAVEPQGDATPQAADGWVMPPQVQAVRSEGRDMIVSGIGQPGGRVVLRTDTGAAFAAVADDAGRFEIRMARPLGDLQLHPETQRGQEAAPSPETLVILAGGAGPIAILSPGVPTRRLDTPPALGALDTDGRVMIVSGYAALGTVVEVSAAGRRPTAPITADAAGQWMAVLPDVGAASIRVGEAVFDYPGASASAGFDVRRAGSGWLIHWSAPDGAAQTTWLPAA